ncbi:unnamed protein product [Choristocarpus tenellus]
MKCRGGGEGSTLPLPDGGQHATLDKGNGSVGQFEVRKWLEARSMSLGKYAELLEVEGFDTLESLAHLSMEDIQLIPGMRRGERICDGTGWMSPNLRGVHGKNKLKSHQ